MGCKSLVQEVIEAAGHICIFLPKFHCELNFIEFFWGAMKKYLREHCDYTYSGLQKNIPDALKSVDVLYDSIYQQKFEVSRSQCSTSTFEI